MIEEKLKSAVRALGAVAAAMSIAGCGGDRGLIGARMALPAPDFAAQNFRAPADPWIAGSGGADLPRTTVIDQLDDEHLTTIELRHFAIYNRFRAAAGAATGGSAGSPFLTNADALRNFSSGGGGLSNAEHFSCPGRDSGM
jgi:hypothetical protein